MRMVPFWTFVAFASATFCLGYVAGRVDEAGYIPMLWRQWCKKREGQ